MPEASSVLHLRRLPQPPPPLPTPTQPTQRSIVPLPMRAKPSPSHPGMPIGQRATSIERSQAPGAIRTWPLRERPRERMQACGVKALSDSELLALFVRTGTPGHSAVDIGRALMQRFGSLNALLHAESAELDLILGIGPSKIAQLKAVSEIVQRALAEEMAARPSFDCAEAVGNYLQLMIGSRPYEVFVSLYLDIHHRLICAEESSRGTLSQTAVYPREIVRRAMQLNAAGLIVAHNHPSGDVAPSDADRALTRHLDASLRLVDVKLLDHLIVSAGNRFSFAEHGCL